MLLPACAQLTSRSIAPATLIWGLWPHAGIEWSTHYKREREQSRDFDCSRPCTYSI